MVQALDLLQFLSLTHSLPCSACPAASAVAGQASCRSLSLYALACAVALQPAGQSAYRPQAPPGAHALPASGAWSGTAVSASSAADENACLGRLCASLCQAPGRVLRRLWPGLLLLTAAAAAAWDRFAGLG